MAELVIDAKIQNISKVQNYVLEYLKDKNLDSKTQSEIEIIIDEILSNIIKYGYENIKGSIKVQVMIDKCNRLNIIFIDNGKRFNPLSVEIPDISLSAENRKIGGLGIYISKNISDDIKYEYINNQNVLTILKSLK